MSHRALVAERQRNGRFNIYQSQNGAENLQLLDELREALNVHGRIDWESLNGKTASKTLSGMRFSDDSQYTMESNLTDNIVEPHPIAVNVHKEDVLKRNDLLANEVLYVVDDEAVDAYWLAWTYPNVIRPWRDHLEAEVYDSRSVPNDSERMLAFFEDSEPLRPISDFEQGWLTDDLVREVVQGHHRWLYEVQTLTGKRIDEKRDGGIEEVPQLLQTPNHYLRFYSDTTETIVPSSLPFFIPIHVGSTPNASAKQIRAAVAQTRFNIGAGLNAADDLTTDKLRQSYVDAILEIVDTHVNSVATEFIPGRLGEVIEDYQQTRDWPGLAAVWKN